MAFGKSGQCICSERQARGAQWRRAAQPPKGWCAALHLPPLPVAHGLVQEEHYWSPSLPALPAFVWLHPALPQGGRGEGGDEHTTGPGRWQSKWSTLACLTCHPERRMAAQAVYNPSNSLSVLLSSPEQPMLAFAGEGGPSALPPSWSSSTLASSLSLYFLRKCWAQPEESRQTSESGGGSALHQAAEALWSRQASTLHPSHGKRNELDSTRGSNGHGRAAAW